jgi:hypothetical protein
MEIMAKSLKNTQVKEQKLGMLQKKCQSIEDKLQDLRRQKKDLQTRQDANSNFLHYFL